MRSTSLSKNSAPLRALIVSYTAPLPSWGGAMTFYRHFVERSDFEIMVLTVPNATDGYDIPYTPTYLKRPRWWDRICRTRLSPWLSVFENLFGSIFLSRAAIDEARAFDPDFVFTVAGSWDWTALAAQKISRTLQVPLVSSFNDWFNYGWFPSHPQFHKIIERRFRAFYSESDLALCTCEGMREELGEHSNSYVWYPTGAPTDQDAMPPPFKSATVDEPLTVFFGGNLGDWYGQMLEELIVCCRESYPQLRFKIFGFCENWSDSFDHWARKAGVFLGRLDFDALKKQAASADLLLLPMGFEDSCAQVERTSFKTKFLDYLSFERPILVWGPEYCSAVRTANEFDSAETVIHANPQACAEAIEKLSRQPDRRESLLYNAKRMYETRFHPDKIHTGLLAKIEELVNL